MDDETNPEAEAPEVEAVATEEAPLDVDLDDEGNPVEPEPELETIEIERGGKKFQIPNPSCLCNRTTPKKPSH
mgnify:CR=1 FL=1